MKTDKMILRVPEWLLGYIFNADTEGLSAKDLKAVDRLYQDNEILGASLVDGERYFSNYNDFLSGGAAATVYDIEFRIRAPMRKIKRFETLSLLRKWRKENRIKGEILITSIGEIFLTYS